MTRFLTKSARRKRSRRRDLYLKWRNQENARYIGVPKEDASRIRRAKREYWQFNFVTAPEVFSFNENPEGVIDFIGDLEINLEDKIRTFVRLDAVTKFDHGAILTLLAIMVKFKAHNVKFNGNTPKNKTAATMIKQSGFFKHLDRSFRDTDRYSLENGGKNEIIAFAWKKVDASLGDKVISEASKTIWGEVRRCQGVQRTLVELMHNTNNHAAIDGAGKTHWWLYVGHDEENRIARFAFVDFGVGVFSSLDKKPETDKFYNWKDKLLGVIAWHNNADLLKLILEGGFHHSVTGNYFRGKGLPGIASSESRNQISSLKVITNDAYGSPGDADYRTLAKSFNGTYLYWELRSDNVSCREEEI